MQPAASSPHDSPSEQEVEYPGVARTARLCGMLVLLLGALGALGGCTGWLEVARIAEGLVPMALSTAAIFLLIGGALVFLPDSRASSSGRMLRTTIAGVVALTGMFNALEFVLRTGSAADPADLLARQLQNALGVAYTPMSPATGVLFLVAGTSLLLAADGRRSAPTAARNTAGLLGLLTALAGFTVTLAYAHGNPLLYGSDFVPVAFSTGVAFMACGLGLLCDAGPHSLPVRLGLGESIQARLLRIFPPLVLVSALAPHSLDRLLSRFSQTNNSLADSIWATAFACGAVLVTIHLGRTVGASLDQTEAIRRKAEKTLRESEHRYRKVLDTFPNGIVELDTQGTILFCNRALETLYGYEAGEMNGMDSCTLATDDDDQLKMRQLFATLTKEHPAPTSMTFNRRRKDGRIITVQVDWNYRESSRSDMEGFIASVTDITEKARSEQELRESEELLRKILQGIKAGIVVIDPKTFLIMDINPTAEAILGQARQDVVGKTCRSILWRSMRTGEAIDACPLNLAEITNEEFRLERPDGKIVPIAKTVITAMHNRQMLIFEIIFDFSERKALERQLAVAQRLESIGQLASGIAHEINTPIQYVGDNLSFLETAFAGLIAALRTPDAPEDPARPQGQNADMDFILEEIPKALAQSREGVTRVATIVQAMKRFSHPGSEEKMLLDVRKAIENTVIVARNEWKYHAEVDLDLDPEGQFLLCYAGDFNQVLLNMLVNAAHAVSEKFKDSTEKGHIRIQTRREEHFLALTIADTGTGIPEKNLQRIYDPFFTTKEIGKGTGQGLAIVHDIVVIKHGGSVTVDSQWGEGTTFVLRFPLSENNGETR